MEPSIEVTARGAAPATSTGAAPPALEVRGLTKRFGRSVAVEDLSLTVERGDVYGFLGPNGSGKSTTIRAILGLLRPTEGEVRLLGRPADGPKGRERVAGFVEAPGFYEYLSARDNLRILGAADRRGRGNPPPIGKVLEIVGLSGRARDKVGAYSQGMKQRLAIAAALLREPEFLVLDEPTNGLDPSGMRDVRAMVRRLSGEGLTIFLSTHLLSEVEQLCNRVAVVSRGRLVAEGSMREILEGFKARTEYRLEAGDPEAARRTLAALPGVEVLGPNGRGEEGEIRLKTGEAGAGPVVRALVEGGVEVRALIPERPSLETLFIELTEGDG